MKPPRILIIAGSDSGGGAGIQADIKTVTMLGGHAMTAITAVTAQNTLGVQAVMPVPAQMVVAQIDSVVSDIGVDAVKIGMIGSAETALAVAGRLRSLAGIPILFDPVMVATSGDSLADAATVAGFEELIGASTLITPNAPELAALTGMAVDSPETIEEAAAVLARRFGIDVLAKGGHLPGDELVDILVGPGGTLHRWRGARIETSSTHGTGCTLASAIATMIGGGSDLLPSIFEARLYVRAALSTAPGFGGGHGPMDHAVGGIPWGCLKDPFVPDDEPEA